MTAFHFAVFQLHIKLQLRTAWKLDQEMARGRGRGKIKNNSYHILATYPIQVLLIIRKTRTEFENLFKKIFLKVFIFSKKFIFTPWHIGFPLLP